MIENWWRFPQSRLYQLPPHLLEQEHLVLSMPFSGRQKAKLLHRTPRPLNRTHPDTQAHIEALTLADAVELFDLIGPNPLTLVFAKEISRAFTKDDRIHRWATNPSNQRAFL